MSKLKEQDRNSDSLPQREIVALYIEDDPTNRLLVKKILQLEGISVIEAEDGLVGLEIAKKEKVDIIILDINMGGMNGYEIATRIKSIDKLKNIPLVAFTANVLANSKARALISGCDGYITKPIDRENFVKEIKEYLNGKKDFLETEKIPELIKEYNIEIVEHLEKEVRELKRLNEDLKQIDKIKSDFISIASHELRTPLVTIIGYVGLLLSNRIGTLSEEQIKILSVVDRNAKRLEKIIKDLVTLSKLENKEYKIKYEIIDIANVIKTLFEDYALILANRCQEGKFYIFGEIPKIEANEEKISELISNLLNNAIKFTEDGGKIEISLYYPSNRITKISGFNPSDYIDILVEDNGIGIPESKLSKIFEKFVELIDIEKHHTSDTEFMGSGAGIGLSICKEIVKNHNGYIWAENRDPKGSTFVVILPVKQIKKEPIIMDKGKNAIR